MLNRSRWIGVLALMTSLGFVSPAGAQAFSDVQQALLDYSKADFTPRKTSARSALRSR